LSSWIREGVTPPRGCHQKRSGTSSNPDDAVGVRSWLRTGSFSVALKPRDGAYLVAAWLAGTVVDLLTYSYYYDIALRDFGLLLGALTLGRLAMKYDSAPLRLRR
jgi:hypothetical protein